jgi:hypothetical protein
VRAHGGAQHATERDDKAIPLTSAVGRGAAFWRDQSNNPIAPMRTTARAPAMSFSLAPSRRFDNRGLHFAPLGNDQLFEFA